MSYLTFIGDDQIKSIVSKVLAKGINKKKTSEHDFYKNVIDPFGSLFEIASFDVDLKTWKESELIRQCQKTLQNQIGTFHQELLGQMVGWKDLGTGAVIDVKNKDRKIIAEIKNKYNTVSGGALSSTYTTLENLVMPKTSEYKGYTVYFVNIIPKKPERFNICFQPSDKERGVKCQKNDLIRNIDGASFYDLVTGEKDTLERLYTVLPTIISDVMKEDFDKDFKQPVQEELMAFYDSAYTNYDIDS